MMELCVDLFCQRYLYFGYAVGWNLITMLRDYSTEYEYSCPVSARNDVYNEILNTHY